MGEWPQVRPLLYPQCADDALTTKPELESSLIGEHRDRRDEGCRHVHRPQHSLDSGAKSRSCRPGIIGEITKRARAAQPATL